MSGTSWNDIPFNKDDTPEQKADNFDRQYTENREAGSDKEYSGQTRPEPEGRGSHGR